MSSPILTVFTVLESNIGKRRMLFPIMSISVQEAKESDVRKFTSVTLLCIGTFYSCNGMYVPNFSSYEIPKWTAH